MKKKFSITLLLLLATTFIYSQKKEMKEIYNNITQNKVYTIDGIDIVTSRVVDNLKGGKDEIYIKVKDFFIRYYKDANSVIQTDDKEAGTIIAKGLFSRFWETENIGFTWGLYTLAWSSYHVLRVDIKNDRIRIICSCNTMNYKRMNAASFEDNNYVIVKAFPFTNKKEINKDKQLEAFVLLVNNMNSTIDALEKTVKEGSLSIEKEDW